MVVHVWDGELIVTMPGSNFKAVYYKPADQPQLIAKAMPTGTQEFKARAWWEANQRARSMGWIVSGELRPPGASRKKPPIEAHGVFGCKPKASA